MANRRFPAMWVIAWILRIFAVAEAVAVVILVIVRVASSRDVQTQMIRQMMIVENLVAVAFAVIFAAVLFALAELLNCFMAIEENTRLGRMAVINLQSVMSTAIDEQTQKLEQRLAVKSSAPPSAPPVDAGTCWQCGFKFKVTDSMRGQQATCPKCGTRITI